MDVSSINSFLQALYVYVFKELVIIILAWVVISLQILYKDYKRILTKITRKMKLKEDLKKNFQVSVNTKQHTKILRHILECLMQLSLKVSYHIWSNTN